MGHNCTVQYVTSTCNFFVLHAHGYCNRTVVDNNTVLILDTGTKDDKSPLGAIDIICLFVTPRSTQRNVER